MKTLSFYWSDLTPECQNRLREFLNGKNGNFDVIPFATLESDADLQTIEFVSVWDSGLRITTKAKYDPDTKKVYDIEQCTEVNPEDIEICNGEYVVIDGKEYDLDYNGDGTYTVLC